MFSRRPSIRAALLATSFLATSLLVVALPGVDGSRAAAQESAEMEILAPEGKFPDGDTGWVVVDGSRHYLDATCRAVYEADGYALRWVPWSVISAFPKGDAVGCVPPPGDMEILAPEGRFPDGDTGWVVVDGSRHYLDATCRAVYEADGFLVRWVPWSVISAFPKGDAVGCVPPPGEMEILAPEGEFPDGDTGWVVVDGSRHHLDATCRAVYEADGYAVRWVPWSVIAEFPKGDDVDCGDDRGTPDPRCDATGSAASQAECDALLAVYDANPDFRLRYVYQVPWADGGDPCDWAGVRCSAGVGVYLLSLSPIEGVERLPDEIGGLSNLTFLGLVNVGLAALPAGIGDLHSLTELQAGGNDFTSLPSSFGNLTNLSELYLSPTRLTELPPSFGNLTNLTYLYMQGATMTTLPPTFGDLANLQTLILPEVPLTALPSSFGDLASLDYLNLGGTALTSLPSSFGDLASLEVLWLSDTRLTSLPSSFADLTSLRTLYMSRTGLTSVPSSIGDLASIQELDLSGNDLTTVPSWFGDLTSLQELDLQDTELASVPASIGTLPNLERLWLRRNRLRGDVSSWAGPLADTHEDFGLWLADGPDGNNCLFVTDLDTAAWLDVHDPGWDYCEGILAPVSEQPDGDTGWLMRNGTKTRHFLDAPCLTQYVETRGFEVQWVPWSVIAHYPRGNDIACGASAPDAPVRPA